VVGESREKNLPTRSKSLSRRGHAHQSSSLGRVAWVPEKDLEFTEWVAAGKRLGAIGRGCQWWIGDWIRYGKARFGERYAQASRVTGYDVQTLMNMVYVASRFEISRRRENLSWSHHETVAALDPEEQERWLDLTTAQRFSVSDLRLEMRTAQRRSSVRVVDPVPDTPQPRQQVVVCPKCGHEIAQSHN
jgi:hypothetical protein